jgi:hypothetical protein
MNTLCRKAVVKPFGFHAIRHKSAAITFTSKGLNAAQVLMGHYRATTTDIYVHSTSLYTDQGMILDALGQSDIGKAVPGLLAEAIPLCGADMGQSVSHEKEMPQEGATSSEAFCTQEHVHTMLQ